MLFDTIKSYIIFETFSKCYYSITFSRTTRQISLSIKSLNTLVIIFFSLFKNSRVINNNIIHFFIFA